ncbi:MAG: hypothetical protein KF832_19115 [Caldilineaceae bacterium]|nr:hypothetical protein [Caldilineaceae bacterium]
MLSNAMAQEEVQPLLENLGWRIESGLWGADLHSSQRDDPLAPSVAFELYTLLTALYADLNLATQERNAAAQRQFVRRTQTLVLRCVTSNRNWCRHRIWSSNGCIHRSEPRTVMIATLIGDWRK